MICTEFTRALALIATSTILVLLAGGSSVYAEDNSMSRDDQRVKIGFDIAGQAGYLASTMTSRCSGWEAI